MNSPLFFITTHRIKPGNEDAFGALTDEYLRFVEDNEPRTWAHYAYRDPDTGEVALVQVHPDADSADEHMRKAHPLIGRGLELTDTLSAVVYGTPGPVVQEALEHNAANGVAVKVLPLGIGYHVAPAA